MSKHLDHQCRYLHISNHICYVIKEYIIAGQNPKKKIKNGSDIVVTKWYMLEQVIEGKMQLNSIRSMGSDSTHTAVKEDGKTDQLTFPQCTLSPVKKGQEDDSMDSADKALSNTSLLSNHSWLAPWSSPRVKKKKKRAKIVKSTFLVDGDFPGIEGGAATIKDEIARNGGEIQKSLSHKLSEFSICHHLRYDWKNLTVTLFLRYPDYLVAGEGSKKEAKVRTDAKYSSVTIIDGSKALQAVGSQIGLIGEPTSCNSHIDVDVDVSISAEQGAVEVSMVDPTQLFNDQE